MRITNWNKGGNGLDRSTEALKGWWKKKELIVVFADPTGLE